MELGGMNLITVDIEKMGNAFSARKVSSLPQKDYASKPPSAWESIKTTFAISAAVCLHFKMGIAWT